MPVAKIYADCEKLSEPYELLGHTYISISVNGKPRQVRYYTEDEYHKMYDVEYASPKNSLGFIDGYITIFKGDQKNYNNWFKSQNAKYNKFFGWYFPSNEQVPDNLPKDLSPVKLNWTDIANENKLKNDTDIINIVNSLIFDKSESNYQGTVGEKGTFILKVVKTFKIDTKFGQSTLHNMVDKDGNVFVWMTSANQLTEGKTYIVNGTIKEHKIYKNVKQTSLIRCTAIEKN